MGVGAELLDDLMIKNLLQEESLEQHMSEGVWVTASKGVVEISCMESIHIMNTISWLGENPAYPYSDEYIKKFKEEMKKRGALFL